jgi:hypothetical protein
MKLLTYITAALIATASFSTLAAAMSVQQVDNSQLSGLHNMGVISVSGINGSPDDAIRALQQKAMEDGATSYRIIGLDTPGHSSEWRASADIYVSDK